MFASLTVASDIVVVPKQIVVPAAGKDPEPVVRYAAVRSRTGKPFRIVALESPDPDIVVSHAPLGRNGYKVTLKNILPFEDLDEKKLIIRTDIKGAPAFTVPIRVVSD